MTVFIRSMVCDRCKAVVMQVFEKSGLHPTSVALGEVDIVEEALPHDQQLILDAALSEMGFERIDDGKARLIESIKSKVIAMVHHADRIDRKFNWSHILSEALHYEYNYLSNLFSSVEGITLEKYIIRQKIERVKELLFYDELNLSEIANRLDYSSVAHLSSQFKKVTGITPSNLKKTKDGDKNRRPLDNVI